MKLSDLRPAPGSHKRAKRIGRGHGSGRGKTAGRGTKGQGARNNIKPNFEGGQMPLHMRVPKLKGFNNPFRVEYQAINLDTLEAAGLDEVSPETLHAHGLAHKGALIKIEAAGGTVEIIPTKVYAKTKRRRDEQGKKVPAPHNTKV